MSICVFNGVFRCTWRRERRKCWWGLRRPEEGKVTEAKRGQTFTNGGSLAKWISKNIVRAVSMELEDTKWKQCVEE